MAATKGVDVERLARQQAAQQELRYPIGRNSVASVIFNGPVTQEAIGKLIVLLEASQDTFPTKAELEDAGKRILGDI